MVKMTRKSYKRRKIILGVSLFSSVALVSTGFAAWVLASQAEAEKTGNITVGTVSDSSIKISNVQFKDGNDSFVFEPKEDDEAGRVRNDGENFENLSVTVTGEISPNTYVTSATIEMEVPEGITAAVGKNYLVLPDCATSAQTLTLNPKESPNETVSTFEYTITFKWGEAFNGKNPGEYYDNDEAGKLVEDETMKTTLEDLRTCIYNSQEEDPTFTVTIKAMN
ncbi:unknown [Firmicutes bacterium CAG:631]|nr:unknown [Firmicutes bacterium CAG:631]